MSLEYEAILYEDRGRQIHITLNRPERRNALSPSMLQELISALQRADAARDASVIVLRGAGDRAFCAGADLEGMRAGSEALLSTHEARGLFAELFLRLLGHSKVTLAAVNGHCMAGGLGVMLACDLAIGRSGFLVGTPEIKRGLFPFMVSALLLRTIGRRAATELMVLGDSIRMEDAARIGLVNRVVSSEEFDSAVAEWADKLSSYSPAVLRLGRRALLQQDGMPLEGALAHLQSLITINALLDDAAEGVAAYFEKRDPVFRGS